MVGFPIFRVLLVTVLVGGVASCSKRAPDITGDQIASDEVLERYPTLRKVERRDSSFEEMGQILDRFGDPAGSESESEIKTLIVQGRPFARSEGTPKVAGTGASGNIVLNFENTEIREVAKVVLGDMMKANFSVDERVKGKVSLQSTKPIPATAAVHAFEAVLRQNKATLIRADGIFRVVPEDEAIGMASVPQLGNDSSTIPPGFSVRIVPLSYISAPEMAEILKPFAGPSGIVRVDPTRNLLVLAGLSSDLRLWMETVNTFDIDWFAGKSVGIFPLKEAAAKSVLTELEAIFGRDEQASGSAVQFMQIDRLNAVMAISSNSQRLQQVQVWVDRLDKGAKTDRRLHVYHMRNAKAVDLAPVLSEMFGGTVTTTNGAATAGTGGVAPGRTPVQVSSEGRSAGDGAEGASRAQRVNFTPPESARYSSMGAAGRGDGSEGIRIIADSSVNALLVMATSEEYKMVSSALRKLDVVPLQVLVEATIAEVRITNDLKYGVSYFLQGELGGEDFSASLGELASTAVEGAIDTVFPGASFVLGQSSRGVLDMLENVTRVNVISSPNLMVVNNQRARLIVGDQVPIATQRRTGALVEDDVLTTTVDYRDTGVIFEVTPRVNSGGTISLDILQEISTATPSEDDPALPTISQRQITSSVVVESGETVILGGLFSDSMSKSSQGVPGLAKVPLIGGLFGRKNKDFTRTELVVLISPRVVRNASEARKVTREIQSRVRGLRQYNDQ